MTNDLNQNARRFRRTARGFTILEVLIALTASLLLMLGLARAYKLLSNKITNRQSELDLSSRLRDVALRLRDELGRATCDMVPPAKQGAAEGYLVYHEGPFTDSTTILGSVANPTPLAEKYFPDSRFGDFDDFLAFTSTAKEGAPFVGFIPRGILDAKRYANRQLDPSEITAYNNTPGYGTQLVPFYSDVAEIAYWVSPQWERNSDGSLVYENQIPDSGGAVSLYPVYRDRNGDLLPDRLQLHRRVLLIRPDLNMTPSEMNAINRLANPSSSVPTTSAGTRNVPTIPFLVGNGTDVEIVPIANEGGGNVSLFPNNTFLSAPGLWSAGPANASPNWLTGIARLQQAMDLSISRVSDRWSAPATTVAPGVTPTYGMPTAVLKANSLGELSKPENRFAHVRIPQSLISGSEGSSMPQIALCPPHPYLIARYSTPPALPDPNDPLMAAGTTPTTFPAQAHHVVGTAPGDAPYLDTYGRFTMTTFVRPEFNLADRVSDVGAGGTSVALINRGGSDVIAEDVVGFDIQIFDPSAPRFVWRGPDGVPGSVGNDDGLTVGGVAAETEEELGWPGSDDEIVTVNDPRIDEVLVNNGNRSRTNWNQSPATVFDVVDRGDFVDLGYLRLAGGPMRGLVQFDESGNVIAQPPTPTAVNSRYEDFASPYSGFEYSGSPSVRYGSPPTAYYSFFPKSWEQSGRFIVSSSGGSNTLSSFYQPVYDTWTDGYAADGMDQEGRFAAAQFGVVPTFQFAFAVAGATPGVPGYLESRVAQDNSGTVSNLQRPVSVRRWSSFDGSIGNQGEFTDQNAGNEQIPENLSTTPIELSPPIRDPLRAIKISIRINDVGAETIRQQTVIQEF